MADFVAVLKKTIDNLGENTPQMREKVYSKARATVDSKLAAISPPPPVVVADRQRKALEEAITTVEADYASVEETDADEFEKLLTQLQEPAPPPAAPVQPVVASTPEPFEAPPAARLSDGGLSSPAAPVTSARADPAFSDFLPAGSPTPAESAPFRPRSERAYQGEDEAIDPVDEADIVANDRGIAAEPARRKLPVAAIAAVAGVIAVGGLGYAAWANRDSMLALFGSGDPAPVAVAVDGEPAGDGGAPAEGQPAAGEQVAAATPAEVTDDGSPEAGAGKFTQRLLPGGEEVDEGPAGERPAIGEGTSVASATTAPEGEERAPAASETPAETPPAATGGDAQVQIGQRAIFYEERTNAADGSAAVGSAVWSVVQESPGGDRPPEAAVRVELSVPNRDVNLRMTIRRNGDPTLPASHIVEMIFLTPENFEGGGIDNVLRIAFKESEEAAGNPLIGIPAKIADGFFLIALSDVTNDARENVQMMRSRNWIDIPIVYRSGRRALVSFEKGASGAQAFEDAMKVWQAAGRS